MVFLSLDAERLAAVLIARRFWNLPYFQARMGLRVVGDGPFGPTIRYESRRLGREPVGCRMRYEPSGPSRPAIPGTLEHFLIERYWL